MFPTRLTAQQMAALPLPAGRLSVQAFTKDDIELRYYAPQSSDQQVPHSRDEFYIVITGRGQFVRAGDAVAFSAGDVLFAAAGEAHRFEDYTPDFATWVVFFGPERPPG